MKIKKMLAFSFLFLAGCNEYQVEDVFFEVPMYQTFSIFSTLDNYVFAPLEIDNHIKLGVHFPIDPSPTSNQIANFEEIAGRHAIYTNTIYLGENLPEIWFWEMIALDRVPNVILQPGNELSPFERVPLLSLAQTLGSFHTPMFLHIFPEARSHGYHPGYYIDFWRYAREVFRHHAPQVALVFTIYEGDVLDFWDFYPGHNYVDWVGINHYVILENGITFSSGTLGRLEAFYQSFNRYKPILIGFGVSHFSTINHMYHAMASGQVLQEFYEEILKNFPRVRAIIYKDINFIEHSTSRNYTDNFSITDSQIVLGYYKKVTENPHFFRETRIDLDTNESKQLIRSSFFAIVKDNEILIPHNFLMYDIELSDRYLNQYLLPHRQRFMEQTFYSSQVLLDIGIKIELHQNRIIVKF